MRRKVFYIFLSECIGTALLIGVGLSVVIFDNGDGSPVLAWIPDAAARRALTGFLFGSTGCLITLSPVGRISGAHINPTVTIAFWLRRRMSARHALGYVLAQSAGAVIGALPLLLWGKMGASVDYGNTVPIPGELPAAFGGEVITSFLLVAGIFFFSGHRRLRRFTPFLIPPFFCVMVWAEGALSGTSTNPARSLGPAVVSGVWTAWWVYLLAPIGGGCLAVWFFKLPVLRRWKVLPKLFHRNVPAA
jgi:aquaporin Z